MGERAISRAGVVAALCMAILAVPGSAQVSDDQVADKNASARRIFEEGRTAFDAKKYVLAIAKFEASYELVRKPKLLFNIGSAYDRAGRPADAVKHYDAYLAAIPTASNRSYVESRLVLLRPKLEPANVETRLIEVEAPGRPSQVGPILLMSLGGAAGVTAIVTGVMALSAKDDLDAMCSNGACAPVLQSTFDRKHRLAVVTDVLTVLSIVSIVGGIIWWVVGSKKKSAKASEQLSFGCSLLGCQGKITW